MEDKSVAKQLHYAQTKRPFINQHLGPIRRNINPPVPRNYKPRPPKNTKEFQGVKYC